MKTDIAGPAKHFDTWGSPRSYRYKEEALYSHAPQTPGIYYLVTFDENQNGRYMYIGYASPGSIFDALSEHWRGDRQPAVHDLLARLPNLYFGYIVDSSAKTPEDLQDLYWSMVHTEKPELNDLSAVQPTGRYSEVTYKEKSLL